MKRHKVEPRVSYDAASGMLIVQVPYNEGIQKGIKALPYTDRKPVYVPGFGDKAIFSHWLIDPTHCDTIIRLVETYLNVTLVAPPILSTDHRIQSVSFQLDYVGRCKIRDDRTSSATGASNSMPLLGFQGKYLAPNWNVIFPEDVLRQFFHATTSSSSSTTESEQTNHHLYAVLACSSRATSDEIKQAYRRMAQQWHPDRASDDEERAEFHQRMVEINAAYRILSDPDQRARYDKACMLADQASASKRTKRFGDTNSKQNNNDAYGYRAPLRCGLLVVEGRQSPNGLLVLKINDWNDIVSPSGAVLSTVWDKRMDAIRCEWL